jgi:hypothetical protein
VGEQDGGTRVVSKFYLPKTKGAKENEGRATNLAFLFAYSSIRRAIINQTPDARIANEGDGPIVRPSPSGGGRGDSAFPYTASFRSATELSLGMKMGARRNKRRFK